MSAPVEWTLISFSVMATSAGMSMRSRKIWRAWASLYPPSRGAYAFAVRLVTGLGPTPTPATTATLTAYPKGAIRRLDLVRPAL